jgi:hypothetical protein
MGRSFAPISTWVAREHYEKECENPFRSAGFTFVVERQNQRMVHRTSRLTQRDEVICQSAADVQYVIGSGKRGRSYVINRDGYLFQSPIAWYSERNRWDLAPHVAGSPEQLYRPIQVQWLFCHANEATHVADTGNRYRRPTFRQYAIGCERCHGPGQLHVERREKGETLTGADDTIVNPRRLAPELRDAVCEQCHLQGVVRILPHGRQTFDFRPGLPLTSFWSVFVRRSIDEQPLKFSSQVEQMHASRCFLNSNGKMGCISCHDPHELPAPEKRVGYYRQRCLTCHADGSCKVPAGIRRQTNAEDSCIACHMPRLENSNIAHMASTDHRILRRPIGGNQARPAVSDPPSLLALIDFHRRNEGVARDRGIALMDLAAVRQSAESRQQLARAALPLLKQALREGQGDAPAEQAKGYALWLLDRPEEARQAFASALRQAPGREETLTYAASLATQLGRFDEAMDHWKRMIDVDPWSLRARFELARLLARRQLWQESRDHCLAALRINPFHAEARMLLVRCALGLRDQPQARSELERLVDLNPRQADSLRRWFAEQPGVPQTPQR